MAIRRFGRVFGNSLDHLKKISTTIIWPKCFAAKPAWNNVMLLLNDTSNAETEILTIAMTFLNKTLNGVPDQVGICITAWNITLGTANETLYNSILL